MTTYQGTKSAGPGGKGGEMAFTANQTVLAGGRCSVLERSITEKD